MSVHPHFAAAIGRNLHYWLELARTDDDAEKDRLLPQQGEIYKAAHFASALPATQPSVVDFIEHYFSIIERQRLEAQWLPLLKKLIASPFIQADLPRYHVALFRYTTLLRLADEYDKAATLSADLLAQLRDPLLTGKVYLNLSLCAYEQGNLQDAFGQAEAACVCFITVGDARWEALALNDLGMIATDLQQYDRAEQFLERALAFEQRAQDATCMVRVLINFGRLHEQRNRFWQALRVYFAAQAFLNETKSVWDAVAILINLSNVYNHLEQYEKACDTLYKAEKRLRRNSGLKFLQALVKLNLGFTYYQLGQFERSLTYSQRAAHLCEQLGKATSLARTQINCGKAYQQLAQNADAAQSYQNALTTLADLTTPRAQTLRMEAQQALAELALLHQA